MLLWSVFYLLSVWNQCQCSAKNLLQQTKQTSILMINHKYNEISTLDYCAESFVFVCNSFWLNPFFQISWLNVCLWMCSDWPSPPLASPTVPMLGSVSFPCIQRFPYWHGAGQWTLMPSGVFGLFLHLQPSGHAGTHCAHCMIPPQPVTVCVCDSAKRVFFNTRSSMCCPAEWTVHRHQLHHVASAHVAHILWQMCCVSLAAAADSVGITLCVLYDLIYSENVWNWSNACVLNVLWCSGSIHVFKCPQEGQMTHKVKPWARLRCLLFSQIRVLSRCLTGGQLNNCDPSVKNPG